MKNHHKKKDIPHKEECLLNLTEFCQLVSVSQADIIHTSN